MTPVCVSARKHKVRSVRCKRSSLPSSRPSCSCPSQVIIGAGPGSVPAPTPTKQRSAKDAELDQQPWSPTAGHGPDRYASRRPPNSHPSAWQPSECLTTIRVRACPPAGRCHSDGPLSLGSPATSDTPRNSSCNQSAQTERCVCVSAKTQGVGGVGGAGTVPGRAVQAREAARPVMRRVGVETACRTAASEPTTTSRSLALVRPV